MSRRGYEMLGSAAVVALGAAAIIGVLWLFFWLASTAAKADDCRRVTVRSINHDWSGPYYTYHRVWRCNPTRVYSYVRREDDRYEDHERGRGKCLSMHRAIGSERYDREKAKEDARQQWAALVRFHHGVRFMDLSYARNVVFTCSKSSTGERASEKAAAVLSGGGSLSQCEIQAVPCAADRVHERDER